MVIKGVNKDFCEISFKKTFSADDGQKMCDCLQIINELSIVCYFLILGAFWQSQMKKMRSRLSKMFANVSSRRTEKSNVDDDESIALADSWISRTTNTSFSEDTSELDSSGDSVGENVHFITYLEEEDQEGFQDDDYTDIFRYDNSMTAVSNLADNPEDVEAFLDQYEIDWDAPLPVSADKELAALNDSFTVHEGTFVDDDYSAVLAAVSQPEFVIPDAGDLLEDSYFPESFAIVTNSKVETKIDTCSDLIYDEQRIMEKYGQGLSLRLKEFLDAEPSTVPVYDDDVLAAILGLQKVNTTYKQKATEVTERFISQLPITDKDKMLSV